MMSLRIARRKFLLMCRVWNRGRCHQISGWCSLGQSDACSQEKAVALSALDTNAFDRRKKCLEPCLTSGCIFMPDKCFVHKHVLDQCCQNSSLASVCDSGLELSLGCPRCCQVKHSENRQSNVNSTKSISVKESLPTDDMAMREPSDIPNIISAVIQGSSVTQHIAIGNAQSKVLRLQKSEKDSCPSMHCSAQRTILSTLSTKPGRRRLSALSPTVNYSQTRNLLTSDWLHFQSYRPLHQIPCQKLLRNSIGRQHSSFLTPCSPSVVPSRQLAGGSLSLQSLTVKTAGIHQNHCISFKQQLRQLSSKSEDTVERQLLKLMEDWELEDAVELLQLSVKQGNPPHRNVVLNLLQQLANLGEVDILLQLQGFLSEQNLVSDYRFYECLHEAYYYSGRVEEGVSMLRLMYHRTRKFEDVDIFFVLLTTMILRHFPEKLEVLLMFVEDLKEAEEPVLDGELALWKCYMLTENFAQADSLLLSNEELRPLLPRAVSEICLRKNKVECNRVEVLKRLKDLPFLKQRLRLLVMESLAAALCDAGDFGEALDLPDAARQQNLPMTAVKVRDLVIRIEADSEPIICTDQFNDKIELLLSWCSSLEKAKE